MPEVKIEIGGRSFAVACQEGEEQFLYSAASLLDREAQTLLEQVGRMPEERMLLMAGLMLADKLVGSEERARAERAEASKLVQQIETLKAAPAERVEIPVVPDALRESLAEMAAQAEALADRIEESEES
ncbi:cell division protein ZapA [Poseidonocella sedimentorum]|uniref:Cell division protein ZapA n=1 Tax=Poseidonocella sedimentorum TaxID=871652 RepID=A0A1I6CRP4_9RHOB|nr:cell division protein ZapA [Poseidonocella sedimentorum]SFQ95757.1 cell division protein ZapA [Poseidonocella sedimentorum]